MFCGRRVIEVCPPRSANTRSRGGSTVHIDRRRLDAAHQALLQWLRENGEEHFTSFASSDVLRENEIDYKLDHRGLAREVLDLRGEFPDLIPGEGEILARTQQALRRAANLLQNVIERYGTTHAGVVAFFHPGEHATEVERLTQQLLTAEVRDPSTEFDELCDYLRSVDGFGCQWAPMSYLLFLLDSGRYFPIHSGQFANLLNFYEVEEPFAGKVTWERYQVLLDVAEELGDYLAPYEPRHAVDIQSYMYMVSHSEWLPVARSILEEGPEPRPFEEELKRRRKNAENRETVGMLGEQYVVEKERENLVAHPELARNVRAVAWESDEYGYDIISFEPDGTEIHIEVKATSRSEGWANQFHLSAHEAEVAAAEPKQWRLYRVTDVERNPQIQCLGNVVTDPPEGWSRSVNSFCYRRDG
jgi:hypothetical protein